MTGATDILLKQRPNVLEHRGVIDANVRCVVEELVSDMPVSAGRAPDSPTDHMCVTHLAIALNWARARRSTSAREVGGSDITTTRTPDYECVVAVSSGEADYFFGNCQSDAGGALALGMLGSGKSLTVSMLGKPPAPGAIKEAIQEDRVVCGMTSDHIEQIVPRRCNCDAAESVILA